MHSLKQLCRLGLITLSAYSVDLNAFSQGLFNDKSLDLTAITLEDNEDKVIFQVPPQWNSNKTDIPTQCLLKLTSKAPSKSCWIFLSHHPKNPNENSELFFKACCGELIHSVFTTEKIAKQQWTYNSEYGQAWQYLTVADSKGNLQHAEVLIVKLDQLVIGLVLASEQVEDLDTDIREILSAFTFEKRHSS